jgi:hypothetical protein
MKLSWKSNAWRALAAGPCFFLTAAAQYASWPAPLLLTEANAQPNMKTVLPGETIASFAISNPPAARLASAFAVQVAGRTYNLHEGDELSATIIVITGDSKEVPRNTKVYCGAIEKVSKDQRRGALGFGGRYYSTTQLCLLPDSGATSFSKAFLVGAKSEEDRTLVRIGPISYALVPDKNFPTRLDLIYATEGNNISLIIDRGPGHNLAERGKASGVDYVFVRPKQPVAEWTGFQAMRNYEGSLHFRASSTFPVTAPVLDGTLVIDSYDPISKAIRVRLTKAPSVGPLRAVLYSTTPLTIML